MAGIGLGVICGRLGDIYGHQKMFGSGMGIMARWIASLRAVAGCFPVDPVSLCTRSWRRDDSIFRPYPGVSAPCLQGSEGKAQGLMAMSHQFGFFIGPPIGGLIIDLDSLARHFFSAVRAEPGRHGALFYDRTLSCGICFRDVSRSIIAEHRSSSD